jgi:hypothetical protein
VLNRPLDDLEQRVLVWAALLGAVVSAVLAGAGLWAALLGLPIAGFLYLTARRRNRLLASLAVFLLAFGPWGAVWVVGAPFLLAGMWVTFRGKPTEAEIAERRAARDAKLAERRAARAASGKGGKGGKEGAAAASPSKAAPKPSKRYTPPGTRRR